MANFVDHIDLEPPPEGRRKPRRILIHGKAPGFTRIEREYARLIAEGPRPERKEAAPTFDGLFPEYLARSEKVGGRRGKAHGHWLFRQRVEYHGTHGSAGWIRPRFGLWVPVILAPPFPEIMAP